MNKIPDALDIIGQPGCDRRHNAGRVGGMVALVRGCVTDAAQPANSTDHHEDDDDTEGTGGSGSLCVPVERGFLKKI